MWHEIDQNEQIVPNFDLDIYDIGLLTLRFLQLDKKRYSKRYSLEFISYLLKFFFSKMIYTPSKIVYSDPKWMQEQSQSSHKVVSCIRKELQIIP